MNENTIVDYVVVIAGEDEPQNRSIELSELNLSEYDDDTVYDAIADRARQDNEVLKEVYL